MECAWIDEEWIEDLIWCPSQCYRRIRCDGKIYTLYLRWRWEDPWEFRIAEGDMVSQRGPYIIDLRTGKAGRLIGIDKEGKPILEEIKWEFITDDLFSKYSYYFRDLEYKEAEKQAERLFLKWVKQELTDP
ncbi:MAG TPA: hypothetical protein ENF75_02670 [Acidilobales archaeon]|nr:hypothetical protein [Acidilobales archaeon]